MKTLYHTVNADRLCRPMPVWSAEAGMDFYLCVCAVGRCLYGRPTVLTLNLDQSKLNLKRYPEYNYQTRASTGLRLILEYE
jgi:hypothetical protein